MTKKEREYRAKNYLDGCTRHFRKDCKAKGITKADALRLSEGQLSRTTIARLFDGEVTSWRFKTFCVAATIVGEELSVFAAKAEALMDGERVETATGGRMATQ